MNKLALLQGKLPLKASLTELLCTNASALNLINYGELPIAVPVTDSKFENWKQYVYLYQFSNLYPDNENGSLVEVLKILLDGALPETDFLKALANYTGWEEKELTDLKIQMGLPWPTAYQVPSTFIELDKAINLLVTSSVKPPSFR